MPLVAEDIEQVKSIVLETFQEHSSQLSPTLSPSESDRKWDLLERIVRVEEELKYLREDMKRLREEMKQLREDMDKRFTELREDMDRRFTEVNNRFAEVREDMDRRFTEVNRRFAEVREDIQRNFKFTVWVISGWGTLTVTLISLFSLLA